MLYTFRCLDASAGYLHHTPEMAVKILVACVCLHNIARINGIPEPPPLEDEDQDGVRVRHNLGDVPVEHVPIARARAVNVRRRAEFVEEYFNT